MTFWHQAPFVRLLLPFVGGIITAAFFPFFTDISIEIILGAFLVFLLIYFTKFIHTKYIYRWIYGAFLSLLLFLSGYALTIYNTEKFHTVHYSKIHNKGEKIIAKVAEPLIAKKKSFKTVLEIKAVVKGTQAETASGKIIAYLEKDSIAEKIQYGNIICFVPSLREIPPPQNPSEFNYRRYLGFHNIYHQSFIKTEQWKMLESSEDNSIFGIAYRIRNYLRNIFLKYDITGDEYAVASALLLGAKENIDPELMQAYASAGALHVLAVSGLHVGVIFLVLNLLLKVFDKTKYGKIIKPVFLLLGLWFYAVLTGLSPSVMRAATMFSFLTVGKATGRNTNIYNILACSAFFLLLINPYIIMEVGFQLSYLAVIGIVFIQPKLDRLWDGHIPAAGKTGNWFIEKIWGITTVSLAAQIATFPVGLLYFHQFPNYFLFSNMVVIPLSFLIMYCGVMLFAVSPVEIFSEYVALVFKGSIMLLNKSVSFVERLPYSLLQGISINLIETWLIYILIIMMLAFFVNENLKFMKYSFFILIFLLLYQFYENDFQQKQKKFVVYSINKISAYDFIDGKENYLLADSSFISDESRLLFHVRHHWWDLGLNKNNLFDIDKKEGFRAENIFLKNEPAAGFAEFHNKRFAIVNQYYERKKAANKMKVDYILLSGSPKISIRQLLENFEAKQIIIDASNTFFATAKWMKEAKESAVDCYSVARSGAFVAEW